MKALVSADGRLSTTASNAVLGDPVEGQVKRLVVVYEPSDGIERTRRFVETEAVELPWALPPIP